MKSSRGETKVNESLKPSFGRVAHVGTGVLSEVRGCGFGQAYSARKGAWPGKGVLSEVG